MSRREVHWAFLGRVGYVAAQGLQEGVREEVKRGSGPERLLLLEHDHVYTVGRNGSVGEVLEAGGVEVVESDRGGRVTYHGPGQLVGYPVINLSPDRRDVRRYVRDLQETIVATLAEYGIDGQPREGQDFVGVWVGREKIASIGVHLSRWVTTHGFALNVTTDLSMFGGIVPCGLQGVEITSIERLTGRRPGLGEVVERYAEVFAERFGRVPVMAAPEGWAVSEPAAVR